MPAVMKSAYISIHALRTEGDKGALRPVLAGHISIHALRTEGDWMGWVLPLPCRISIHALRTEGDAGAQVEISYNGKFLSTPSVRRATCSLLTRLYALIIFLSTPSVRRAT